MEVAVLIAASASAGLAVLLAFSRDGCLAGAKLCGLGAAVALRSSVALARLSASVPVRTLLALPSLSCAARDVSGALDGLGLVLDEGQACVLLLLGMGCCGVVAAALMASAVAGVATLVLAGLLVVLRERRARVMRSRELVQEMPAVFRTLSVAMGSGQTLAQAVEYVGSHERGPAAPAFTRLSLRLRCGMGVEEALDRLSDELDAPGVDLLSTALVIAHRTGSPLRDLLVRSARLVERQGEFQRLLAVKTAQVRLSVRIVCALPVVMVIVLALISPDFQRGLLTPAGAASLALAMALDATALLIIRRLMKGVI